jgi:hypothetical protein
VIGLLQQLAHLAAGAMRTWYKSKMAIEHASVVSSDALHLAVGPLLWLAAAIALRKRLADWLPWLVVLAAASINEGVDLWIERWPSPREQYAETTKDIFLTILLPTVLMLAVRLRPKLFRR